MYKLLIVLIICFGLVEVVNSADPRGDTRTVDEGVACREVRARAVFNKRGLRGIIHFTEYCNKTVRVHLNFSHIPFDSPVPYHVHLYPVDSQRPSSNQCGSDLTGGHHDPTMRKEMYGTNYTKMCSMDRGKCERGDLSGKYGRIYNGTVWYMDDNLSLTGIYGIMFRSIVLHMPTGPRYICATIEPYTDEDSRSRIITASARFYGPRIAGYIHFFQSTSSDRNVRIFVDLFSVDNQRERLNLDWYIYYNRPNSRINCNGIVDRFNPDNRDSVGCTPSRIANCSTSDLSDKHSRLNITRDDGSSDTNTKYLFTEDEGITLCGRNSIISHSVVILSGETRVGCARIHRCQPIVLVAEYGNVRITVTSYNRFLAKRLEVTGSTKEYRSITIENEAYEKDRCRCPGIIYNPVSYPPSWREPGQVQTPDQCTLGDLKCRVGRTLDANLNHDFDLPLSGRDSVANRIIRFTDNNNNVYCVEFKYYLSARTDEARIVRTRTRTFTIRGFTCYILFTQLVSNGSSLNGDVLIGVICECSANLTSIRYRITNDRSANNNSNEYYLDSYMIPDNPEQCQERQEACEIGNIQFEGATYVHTNLELTGTYGISEGISYVVAKDSITGATAYAVIEADELNSAVMLKVNLLLLMAVLLLFALSYY